MTLAARVVWQSGLVTLAFLLAFAFGQVRAGGPQDSVPGNPVVIGTARDTFAVAVPALAGDPALAGGSVVFAVEDEDRERLFGIRAVAVAADGTWRTLYAPPRKRPGAARSLLASESSVAALRVHPERIQSCVVDGECTLSTDEVLTGPVDGRLTRLFGATERLAASGTCRRRIAQLEDGRVSLSGERIAYVRRVRCMVPRRRGHSQVVVRNLRSGAVRVVHRGAADRVQLAGRYVAFEPRRPEAPVVVKDVRADRVAYRATVGYQNHFSLGADGTLARTIFSERCCRPTGRLGWHSPRSPRLHRLSNRVAIFSGRPLHYAAGQIAHVSRYDAGEATVSITDLNGSRDLASFRAPEQLEAFAFDGTRFALTHTRYRPDAGAADDGLRAVCIDDRLLVPATASVIEVHPVTDPGRIPAPSLPIAEPYRRPRTERPECPYRD